MKLISYFHKTNFYLTFDNGQIKKTNKKQKTEEYQNPVKYLGWSFMRKKLKV